VAALGEAFSRAFSLGFFSSCGFSCTRLFSLMTFNLVEASYGCASGADFEPA
jgi:hypothetical protein